MILKRLQVQTPQIGLLTNSYIVCDEESKEAMVIDPGGEPERIAEVLDILGANLKYIFVTHCHADHIGGIAELKKLKGGKMPVKVSGYSKGMASASRKIPADIPKKLREEVERVAVDAFKLLGSAGNARIDFLIDQEAGKVYIRKQIVEEVIIEEIMKQEGFTVTKEELNEENIETNSNELVEQSSISNEYWDKEINDLINLIKEQCNSLWVAYDKTKDRYFAKFILTAKEFGTFAEKIWQDRIEFALNVLKASMQIKFRKWICSWPMKIYQNYSEVYNETLRMHSKNSKNLIQSF